MKTPIVTILVATYNQADFLEECLHSVLTQAYPRECLDIVAINDGSTDRTSAVLNSFAPLGVRVFHQENRGLGATCNRGIELAEGRYVIRLDSDDIFHETIVCKTVGRAAADPNVSVVYTDRFDLAPDGRRLRVALSGSNLYEMIACGVLMDTAKVRAVGGYRALFWEEYDLFLRLLDLGSFAHVPEPLYTYRRHDRNMTNDAAARIAGWEEMVRIHGAETLKRAGDISALAELSKLIDTRPASFS